jgi:hypothetical protein
LEDWTSVWNVPEWNVSGRWKLMTMQLKFWSDTGPESEGIGMSEPSLQPETGQSISSVEDSHVRISAMPEPVLASRDPEVDYSTKQSESFAFWNRNTCCWKTYQLSLLEGLETYSGRWPRSGMMRSGTAYPLPVLVRLTAGTGYSSWPTPTARDYKDGTAKGCQNVPENGLLGRVVHSKDSENNVPNGSLNPTWVEWLMGFPEGWTDLSASEMPLFPRSQNSSEENLSEEYRRQ